MNNTEVIADKILRELRESGLSYGEILRVVRLAKEKLENLKKIRK